MRFSWQRAEIRKFELNNLSEFKVSAQLWCMLCPLIPHCPKLVTSPKLTTEYLEVLAVTSQRAWINKHLNGKDTDSWGPQKVYYQLSVPKTTIFSQEKTKAWRYYIHTRFHNYTIWTGFSGSMYVLFFPPSFQLHFFLLWNVYSVLGTHWVLYNLPT